jgi:hypothetical protein
VLDDVFGDEFFDCGCQWSRPSRVFLLRS